MSVYALSRRGTLAQIAPDPEPPVLTETENGFSYVADGHWPRTCLDFVPSCVPVDIDLDSDRVPDARVIVAISVIDSNGSGKRDEGDTICLTPRECRIVGHQTRMVLSEAVLRAICERVARGL